MCLFSRNHHLIDVKIKTKKRRQKTKCPPLFETSGGLYVFDPRSGFFFESQSNFYFDPKSKLYFGNENANMYKDRAKERRFLYGDAAGGAMITSTSTEREDEQMAQLQANGPNLNKARMVLETEVVRPEDSVGAGNIGHQMLQKLGWRKGETLGRKNMQDDEMNVKLKQDWETIETLASTSTSTLWWKE